MSACAAMPVGKLDVGLALPAPLQGALEERGSVAIDTRRLTTLRHEDLLGRLALGVLSLRRSARGNAEAVPLVIVEVPHVTETAAAAARAFMDVHAGEIQWALIADDGDFVIQAPALGVVEAKLMPRRRRKSALQVSRPNAGLFTDLNAWMLKVLLLASADPRWWGGPRGALPRTARELAERAGVSVPHAHRFVRTFEERDHLRQTGDGLVIVRRDALLASWLEAVRQRRRLVVPVRWSFGEPASWGEVFAASPQKGEGGREPLGLDIALGGFEACRVHGLLHTASTGVEIHTSANIKAICEAFDLEPCDRRDAHFTLLSAKRAESIFRGVVPGESGLPVVDALQAALDVAPHAARGTEQAEHIVRDVLGLVDR